MLCSLGHLRHLEQWLAHSRCSEKCLLIDQRGGGFVSDTASALGELTAHHSLGGRDLGQGHLDESSHRELLQPEREEVISSSFSRQGD